MESAENASNANVEKINSRKILSNPLPNAQKKPQVSLPCNRNSGNESHQHSSRLTELGYVKKSRLNFEAPFM